MIGKIGNREYSPENYSALDMDDYRRRFLEETINFSDQQLYNAVMSTEDDLSDDEWRTLFNEFANKINI